MHFSNANCIVRQTTTKKNAATGDRTWDLQIFSLTLSQLSYRGTWWMKCLTVFLIFFQKMLYIVNFTQLSLEPLGAIRKNWNDTEKISMAPAQGWHAQIENVSLFLFRFLSSKKFDQIYSFPNSFYTNRNASMAEWSKAVDLSSILRCRRGFEPHSRHFFFPVVIWITVDPSYRTKCQNLPWLTVAQLVERGTVNVFSGNP